MVVSVHLFMARLGEISCVCPVTSSTWIVALMVRFLTPFVAPSMNTNHQQSALSISRTSKYNSSAQFSRHVNLCPLPAISIIVTIFRYNLAALLCIRITLPLTSQHAKTNMEHLSGHLPNAPDRRKCALHRRRQLFSQRYGLSSHQIQVPGTRAASGPTAPYRRPLEPPSYLCRRHRRADVVRTLAPFLRSWRAGRWRCIALTCS